MLNVLKKLAIQTLQQKMQSNSLNPSATSAAAEQGAGALIAGLLSKVKSGDASAVTSLFSNDGNATEDNDVFQGLVGKLTGVLQEQGMSAEEAQQEANNVAPDLVNGLKQKFQSNDAADSEFDLSQITNLLGGDAGNLLNQAKNLLG